MTADLAALYGVERREPVRASGVVSIVLGGILRVQFPAEANAGSADVDPKAWRRAVSMAVEHAILTRHAPGPLGPFIPRRAYFYGTTPLVREMGGKLTYGRGCAYRGERKRRKAMRRLLRAAGVTVQR